MAITEVLATLRHFLLFQLRGKPNTTCSGYINFIYVGNNFFLQIRRRSNGLKMLSTYIYLTGFIFQFVLI